MKPLAGPVVQEVVLTVILYWLVLVALYLKPPEMLIADRLAFGLLFLAGLSLAAIGGINLWRSAHSQASKAALEDELMGLQNRRAFNSHFLQRVAKADPGGLTLVILDIDDLKAVNDNCGHQAGDELLARVGLFLSELAREPYRIGGDEFALVLDRSKGDRVARTIKSLTSFSHRFQSCGHEHDIQLSYALTTKQVDDSFEAMFRRADLQLREFKSLQYGTGRLEDRRSTTDASRSTGANQGGPQEAKAGPLPEGIVSLEARRRKPNGEDSETDEADGYGNGGRGGLK